MSANKEDQARLFRQVRHSLGAPIRQIELTDDMLITLLEIGIEDYSQYVQEWLIENQWSSLQGKSLTNTDIAFALTTRSIDFESQFTYAYSKQVGLQQRGPWELKKDYVELENGRQVYQIPAGREINEVLWFTPPATSQALFSQYGGVDYGFGGGTAQMGSGTGGNQGGGYGNGSLGGYYIAPAFDVLLTAADYNLKNRLLRSDLTYKVTAGPDGTRLLHLMSTPGSKLTFGNGAAEAAGNLASGAIGLSGSKVWYHYYDTNPGNIDACREYNKDIIKLPNEVPLARLDFSDMNEPTKTLIRQLLIADAKRTLGRVRGKYSGALKVPEADVVMDFESLLSEGNEERIAVLKRLDERLLRLSNDAQLKLKAEDAENLNKTLTYRPLGFYVY
jgi:hypothetical protein